MLLPLRSTLNGGNCSQNRQFWLEIATVLKYIFQKQDVTIRAACTSKSFNALEDAKGFCERNGESWGLRERGSVSVMVDDNSIEKQVITAG